MTKINLAFMLDAVEKNGLDDIINFFGSNYDINDIVVFSKDSLLTSIDSSYGVLSLYHFKFYKGYVVFFRLEDYLEYRNYSLSQNIYLYLDSNTIDNIETLDRNIIKNISILTKDQTSNIIKTVSIRHTI